MEKRSIHIYNEIKKELMLGKFGRSGDKFVSVRELCELKGISLVSSFKICNLLENDGLLFLYKATRFITLGRISEDTPLNKLLKKTPILFGIHIKEINNPYIGGIISFIKKELKQKGFSLIISTSEGDYEEEKKILKQFITMGCSYIIDFPSPCNNNELNDFYNNYPLPLLFIGRTVIESNIPSILTDNFGTGLQIANYLYDCGYTDFYFISLKIPENHNERFLGFKEGLKRHGIHFIQNHYIMIDYNDKPSFSAFSFKLKELAEQNQKIGVFCLNDILAATLLRSLQKTHVPVPDMVGIIGYDDLEISQYTLPSITTVSYDFKKLAEKAIAFLLSPDEFNNKRDYIINNCLTIRHSTVQLPK